MKKLLVYLFPLIFFTNISFAIIEIDITEGYREPLPLAISEFFHDNNPEIIKNLLLSPINLGIAVFLLSKFIFILNLEGFNPY